jgi:GNAT superfamily N-acetyltransferase
MRDHIVIRLAGSGDIHQLAELRWLLQTDDDADGDTGAGRANFVSSFLEAAQDTNEAEQFFHWIAEVNQQIIAVMSVKKVLTLPTLAQPHAHWGYLTNCYTRPEYRNQGVGTLLLGEVKRWAKEEHFELLVVWPSDRSYRFYEKSGFRRDADPLVLKIYAVSK